MRHSRALKPVAALWATCACAGLVVTPAALRAAPVAAQSADDTATTSTSDELIMKNGQTLSGTILEETPTSVKFRLKMFGVTTDVTYPKSDIKEIKRSGKGSAGSTQDGAKIAPASSMAAVPPGSTRAAEGEQDATFSDSEGKTKYYYLELTGEFGSQISQTPIRQAVKEAKARGADYFIMMLDAEWRRDPFKSLPDDAAIFDAIFRAEDIVPIFDEVEKEWEKPPKMIMWVKTAMGGASLLPLRCPTIYMHPEGRIGGIGNLSTLFGSTGDEVVREKQRSLRQGHAEGWTIKGGYDHRLIPAMSRVEYVLSARIEGDKVTLFEGMPKNPGEELLTDDGEKENADTMEERVRGEGNDVLTLKPRIAQILGVSKGTVETKDQLLSALGLDRGAVDVSGRSDRIMKNWRDGLERAQDRLVQLMRQYADVRVQPPGEYAERTAARGQRRRILNEVRGIMRQWEEALTGQWMQENNIPSTAWIDFQEERIKLEQMQDKK